MSTLFDSWILVIAICWNYRKMNYRKMNYRKMNYRKKELSLFR